MSEKNVSKLGYGCYAFSGVYGSKLEKKQMRNVIQTAFDNGITLFDTSSSYGKTEEILGENIRPFRQEVALSTKVGLTKDNSVDLSRKNVIRSCEESLKKLGTDYVDIYQIHYDDPNTPVNETVDALNELKQQGKILSYGIGHLPMDRIKEYLKLGDISIIMSEINAINRYKYMELRELQREFDFNIIAFSITARGLLTGKINLGTLFSHGDIRKIDPLFQGSKIKSGLRIVAKLAEIGNRYGLSPAQVAINWTLGNAGIVSALTGPTKLVHLEENIGALKVEMGSSCLDEINVFLDKEQMRLERELEQDVLEIINKPLSQNADKAFSDLVYVIEYAITNNKAPYEKCVSLYQRILAYKKRGSLTKLKLIKDELLRLI